MDGEWGTPDFLQVRQPTPCAFFGSKRRCCLGAELVPESHVKRLRSDHAVQPASTSGTSELRRDRRDRAARRDNFLCFDFDGSGMPGRQRWWKTGGETCGKHLKWGWRDRAMLDPLQFRCVLPCNFPWDPGGSIPIEEGPEGSSPHRSQRAFVFHPLGDPFPRALVNPFPIGHIDLRARTPSVPRADTVRGFKRKDAKDTFVR